MPNARWTGFVLCIVLCTSQAAAAAEYSSTPAIVPRPFTVADSIALTRIVDPDPAGRVIGSPGFKCSADQSHCLFVTRSGNLRTGYSEYRLFVVDMSRIRVAIGPGDRGLLDVVATFETRARAGGITSARWLPNGKSIAFVGRGRDGVGQVYVTNIRNSVLSQLTHHPFDVAEFALSADCKVIVYSAYHPPDWTKRNAHGYVFESGLPKYLSLRNPQDAIQELRHFIRRVGDDSYREVKLAPSVIAQEIWIAPSGRWAVTLAQPTTVPSAWWDDYEPLQAIVRREPVKGEPTPAEAMSDPTFGRQTPWVNQFLLIDVDQATSRALFDAPAGSPVAGLVAKALWSADSSRVVIANTFLPLSGSEPQRRRTPAIVDYDIASASVTRIADVIRGDLEGAAQLVDVAGSGDQFHAGWTGGRAHIYTRGKGDWIEAKSAMVVAPLTLQVEESLNTPPDVVAMRGTKGVRVTDLNPQLRERTLGIVQRFDWRTRDGRAWIGGLVLPPSYDVTKRYPLVIQTYGFNEQEFLVDGPDGKTCAYAARALANRDIIVLQMPFDRRGFLGPEENSNQLALIESAIDALDEKGTIDRHRVGLIGFSRTGMHVQHAITFSRPEYAITAATICDSISNGYVGYVNQFGTEYPGMLYPERLIGAPFWDQDRALWLERSAAFNLHLIRSALRIEHLGAYPSDYWDTFALLKRHKRPVELIHMPEATHALTQPFARFTSQEGDVDWFDFWLRGHEDPQESKTAQYARWRALRKQKEALDATASAQ